MARDPITVPHKAMDTVIPNVASVSAKYSVMNFVVPEMTAVSKPNRKLPRAETTVANKRFLFMVVPGMLVRRVNCAEQRPEEERKRLHGTTFWRFFRIDGDWSDKASGIYGSSNRKATNRADLCLQSESRDVRIKMRGMLPPLEVGMEYHSE